MIVYNCTEMVESITELFEVLGRDANELTGQHETVWLEFKTAPYQLIEDRHRFELAKDVTAMANADGGVILIGVETKRDPNVQEDVAVALRPVKRGLVDAQRIKDVIGDWVHPRLDIEVRSHAVPGEEGELWSIFVERQRERDLPFIVGKSFVVDGSPNRNLFSVFERTGSHNRPYLPSQVHGWIHRGFIGMELQPSEPLGSPVEEADAVLADDLRVLALPQHATCLYLQAAPEGSGRLSHFYRGAVRSTYDALANPRHNLRSAGFNLPDVGQPERTQSGALRVVWAEADSISVTPFGLTTGIQGQEHLTWAYQKFVAQGECWINPLALVEFTLDFSRFFLMEVLSRSQSARFIWRAGMRDLIGGDPTLYLPLRFEHLADKQQASLDAFDLEWTTSEEPDANGLAYAILSMIYAQFGFDGSVIPYTENGRVSDKAILSIR